MGWAESLPALRETLLAAIIAIGLPLATAGCPGATPPSGAGARSATRTAAATSSGRPLAAAPGRSRAVAGDRAVDLQGHRGARGLHPENSLGGFAAALAIGVTTLEMDLGITRDGEVVVHHDERLNPDIARGPDGAWLAPPTPTLRELSLAELRIYDVGRLRPQSAYARRLSAQQGRDGVHVARLAEVIALAEKISGRSIRYNVETKLSPLEPEQTLAPTRFADRVLAELRAGGVLARATVQSFDWRTLQVVRQRAPTVTTACLTSESADFDTVQVGEPGPSAWTAGLDVDDFGGSVPRLVQAAGCAIWAPNFPAASAARVAEAHGLGLAVAVWTVNDPADIAAMLERGVDAIISDYPDRVRSVLQARGLPLPPRFAPRSRAP